MVRWLLPLVLAAVCVHPAVGLAASQEEIDRLSREFIEELEGRRSHLSAPAAPTPELPPALIREQAPGDVTPPIHKAPGIQVAPPHAPIIVPPAPHAGPPPAASLTPPPAPSALPKPWTFTLDTTLGWARYAENAQTLDSTYTGLFHEVTGALSRRGPADTEFMVRGGFGYSLADTEAWDVNDQRAQTNDVSFRRVLVEGRVGKWFEAPERAPIRTQPFVNYGVRHMSFTRSDFTTHTPITIRHTVDETTWLHHLGGGVRVLLTPSERWEVDSTASLGWVFFNQAENSVEGPVDGKGGVVAGVTIGAGYRLSDAWRMKFAGTYDVQDLEGDHSDTVVWPDSTLQVYGGNVELEYRF